MAAFVVQVHNVVDKVIRTSRHSGKDTNEKIGGELMQLTRAVVKKDTLSPINAFTSTILHNLHECCDNQSCTG